MALPVLVPLDVLFGNPTRAGVAVSPDGTRLAWTAPLNGVLNVFVAPIDDVEAAAPVTSDTDRGIRSWAWAHDGRHLIYVQDVGGDEDWHLHSVDTSTGEVHDRTPFPGVHAQVLHMDRTRPDQILVGLNRDVPSLHDVYRLTLSTGDLELIARNPGYAGWLIDNDWVIRGGSAMRPDGGIDVHVHPADTPVGPDATLGDPAALGPVVHSVGHDDSSALADVGFTADGQALYLISSKDAQSGRLIRLDLASGDIAVLFEDAEYDVAGVTVDPVTHEPQLVAVLRDRAEIVVLDPALAEDVSLLTSGVDAELAVTSRTHDDRRWVVARIVDDGPVRYYRYDRTSAEERSAGDGAGVLTYLFSHKPDLESYDLAPMEPFEFTARDGLTIHGYLTFPLGTPREGLPTVLTVHGGPWVRDAWGYDPEAQWMANRGYLCVQVNYRGSTGYGKDFVNAGDRQWGASMHDDLVDAVAHVVGQGWADPARVGIFGGSYGGYAALAGATFTPDLFACAVDIVGPSNLITLLESIPAYWEPVKALFARRVGDLETERDFLWSRSPLSQAHRIRIPLLIAQGANDPRVKQAESEQIVAALVEKNIPHQYELYADEGHGFAKPSNRLDFYRKAERFLAEHLGGRQEA